MLNYEDIAFHWVNRLGFVIRKELAARFQAAGFDVSPEEWAILLVLWSKGPKGTGALAEVTIKDRTTVTRLIDTMVRKDIVTRAGDPTDRRRSVVMPTEHGMALKDQLIPIAKDLIAQAQADIPLQDLETTTRTLRALTGNLVDANNPERAE